MHALPTTPEYPAASAPQTLIAARHAILAAMSLALVGSIFGFTVGQRTGAVTGPEVWLTGSCVVFCVIVLFLLLRRPFDTIPWVAPLATLYFLGYLTAGGLMSLGREALMQNFMIYLLWFFPLIAFNRFANVTTSSGALSLLIFCVAITLALLRALVFPGSPVEPPLLIVFCLTISALTLVLGLFARYREAFGTPACHQTAAGNGLHGAGCRQRWRCAGQAVTR